MKEDQELKIDKTDYTCDNCFRSFYTRVGLKRHEDACVAAQEEVEENSEFYRAIGEVDDG